MNETKRSKGKAISIVMVLTLALVIGLLPRMGQTAHAADPTTYLDAEGQEQTCSNYTEVTSSSETGFIDYNSEWAVVKGSDVTIAGTLRYNKNFNLILCDGAKLTVKEIYGSTDTSTTPVKRYTLTIYAQSTGSNMGTVVIDGKLISSKSSITINGGKIEVHTIGNTSSSIKACGGITINGGDVRTESNGCGLCNDSNSDFPDADITINDGTVTCINSTDSVNQPAIYNKQRNVVINGGSVTAINNGYATAETALTNGIYAIGEVQIKGGTVTASAVNGAIVGGAGVEINDGLSVKTGADESSAAAVTDFSTNYANYKYASIADHTDVAGVSLDKTTSSVAVDGTDTPTATVSPEGASDKTVSWASSNEAVATVDNGTVTGVSVGTATITATATNGTEETTDDKTATCTVEDSDKYTYELKLG